MTRLKKLLAATFPFIILIIIIFIVVKVIFSLVQYIKALDSAVSVAILTGSTTILVSTLTIVIGKYYERKRDTEAKIRDNKIEMYDSWLCFELCAKA